MVPPEPADLTKENLESHVGGHVSKNKTSFLLSKHAFKNQTRLWPAYESHNNCQLCESWIMRLILAKLRFMRLLRLALTALVLIMQIIIIAWIAILRFMRVLWLVWIAFPNSWIYESLRFYDMRESQNCDLRFVWISFDDFYSLWIWIVTSNMNRRSLLQSREIFLVKKCYFGGQKNVFS